MQNKIKMRLDKVKVVIVVLIIILSGCKTSKEVSQTDKSYERSWESGATEGFCELVSYGVKELGLGVPLSPEEMDKFMPYGEKAAQRHNVSLYRETDLIDTDLFTHGIATGKDVLLIHNGATLTKYLDLKADRQKLEESGEYFGKAREEIARRFGRLLSYTPRTINNQLVLHTDFRTMYHFGIKGSNLLLYYKDLSKAVRFYTEILGLDLVADNKDSKVVQMTDKSYLTLVDASSAPEYANEPKTVALAFVTDQPAEWFDYLKEQDVEIKSKYRAADGQPYNSFVIVDPEGYLIEFERFNQHPQNEDLIPILKNNEVIYPKTKSSHKLSINSSITWLYYKDLLNMQNFYQDVLGLEMIVDQGWVKIYQSSETGFIGLVDEKRGMHNYSEKKAVNVSFIVDELDGWYDYVKKNKVFNLRPSDEDKDTINPTQSFRGTDPEGYHINFVKSVK